MVLYLTLVFGFDAGLALEGLWLDEGLASGLLDTVPWLGFDLVTSDGLLPGFPALPLPGLLELDTLGLL